MSKSMKSSMRRGIVLAIASLPAIALMSHSAAANADFPTSVVNTTGLAVTDDTVTVGILHSITGSMAISETGSVQAEKLAIKQINESRIDEEGSFEDISESLLKNETIRPLI